MHLYRTRNKKALQNDWPMLFVRWCCSEKGSMPCGYQILDVDEALLMGTYDDPFGCWIVRTVALSRPTYDSAHVTLPTCPPSAVTRGGFRVTLAELFRFSESEGLTCDDRMAVFSLGIKLRTRIVIHNREFMIARADTPSHPV